MLSARDAITGLGLALLVACDANVAAPPHEAPSPTASPATTASARQPAGSFPKIAGLVRRQLAPAPAIALNRTTRIDKLPMDSLDQVELVMAIEEEFGLTVDDQTAASLRTLGAWADFIDRSKATDGRR